MHSLSAGLTFTLLFLAGCTIKQGGDSGSASTSEATDTDATLGHSSDPVTTGEPPSVSASTTMTGAPTSGADTTDSDASASGSSGGGPVPTLCESVCELSLMCDPDTDEATCVVLCQSDLTDATPPCAAATEKVLQCLSGLTCEQLAPALAGEPGNICGPEQLDRNDACGGGPDTCDTGGGGNINGLDCMLETQCAGAPVRRIECAGDQCQCFEDNILIGSCTADDTCADLSQLGPKALSCCGFPDNGPDIGP